MGKAKYYIRVDTFWQNSPDTFIGPYQTKQSAETALSGSGIARSDLGQGAVNVRHQTRCLGILTTTKARQAGMKPRNTIPAQAIVPGTISKLGELEEYYGWLY